MATKGGNIFSELTMTTEGGNIFSELTDVADFALVVEDKRLYVNRGALAVISPVFGKMLYGDSKEKSATETLPGKKYDRVLRFLMYVYPSTMKSVFRRMLYGDSKEKSVAEIPLPGKKYDHVLEFLMCVYPSTMKAVSRNNLDILLPLADEYQVDPLKERCDAFIVNVVEKRVFLPDLKELVHLLVLGGKYRLEKAIKSCVKIASRRKFSDLKAMSEFVDISSDVKYQLASLQLERYVSGVQELTKHLRREDVDFYYSDCDHPRKYAEREEVCTKCRDRFIPNILKRIDKFE